MTNVSLDLHRWRCLLLYRRHQPLYRRRRRLDRPHRPPYCRSLPLYSRLLSLSRQQYASPSSFLQQPFALPLVSTCLTSEAHLPYHSVQSASSHISLNILQSTGYILAPNYSLSLPSLISFVAIPRIDRISTII